MIRRIFNLRLDRGTRMYHKNVIDHYENPKNVGSFSKNEKIYQRSLDFLEEHQLQLALINYYL